jgi:hypothetical protein
MDRLLYLAVYCPRGVSLLFINQPHVLGTRHRKKGGKNGWGYAIWVLIDIRDGIWSMRTSHDAMLYLGEIRARRSLGTGVEAREF